VQWHKLLRRRAIRQMDQQLQTNQQLVRATIPSQMEMDLQLVLAIVANEMEWIYYSTWKQYSTW
jgi:hypothetical protein